MESYFGLIKQENKSCDRGQLLFKIGKQDYELFHPCVWKQNSSMGYRKEKPLTYDMPRNQMIFLPHSARLQCLQRSQSSPLNMLFLLTCRPFPLFLFLRLFLLVSSSSLSLSASLSSLSSSLSLPAAGLFLAPDSSS